MSEQETKREKKKRIRLEKKLQYMFKSGKIINQNPILIEYPKDVFERLEPRVSKEKGLDDYCNDIA
ncbi:MAG: hypothetical protein GX453_07990 [Lactococcus chungangensis]|uniref:Uncharacterized protein n=1 Tax=Pseudolactococcus chungangensis TaxID=451457 RepID=A0A847J2Q7_9LACT|nr:hypothetical protein [Lactococcus chungangensis]